MLNKMSFLWSIFVFLGFANNVWCQNSDENDEPTVRVVEPDKKTDAARAAIMDTERYEFGVYTGFLSVEDFNTNPVFGLNFVYHINPKWYAQFNYGSSTVDRSSYEDSFGENYIADSDRDFNYMNIVAAYQILHGRSYFRESGKYNSGFYLVGGIGNVDYAGDSNTSVVIGASYRIIRTDWLLIAFDYRSHILESSFLGVDKQTFNNELAVGLNFFF